MTDATRQHEHKPTGGERYLAGVAAKRIAELEEALRGLIACHGQPPSRNCGYLARAKELLDD
jgi:hypothetical protein